MSEYLTYDRTLELLHEVVAEVGEHHKAPVLPMSDGGMGCRYVDDEGGPCCLVGRVLHRAGASIAELIEVEGDSPRVADFHRWADQSARLLLACVQEEQDNGREWGVALANGIEICEAELAGDPDD